MDWLFLGAYVLLIVGIISVGVGFTNDGDLTGFVVLGLVLIAAGLFVYHWGVVGEVNCFRDGGQMISSLECVVVSKVGGVK